MVSVDEAQAKKEEALFRRSDEIIQMCEENIRKMKRKIQGAIDRPQDVIDGEIHDYYQDRIQDEEKRVRDRHRRFNIARRQTLEDSKESVLKYRSNIERLRKKEAELLEVQVEGEVLLQESSKAGKEKLRDMMSEELSDLEASLKKKKKSVETIE